MLCPECGSPNLRESGACSREPHGESHEDTFLVCANGHRFEASDALEEDEDPAYCAVMRTALVETKAAELAGMVMRRGEWQ